jgi:hypothetical protein
MSMKSIDCPECGSAYWKRIASGTYSAEEYVFTDQQTDVHEEDLSTDRMEVTDWKCGNGHVASDDVNAKLEELDGA